MKHRSIFLIPVITLIGLLIIGCTPTLSTNTPLTSMSSFPISQLDAPAENNLEVAPLDTEPLFEPAEVAEVVTSLADSALTNQEVAVAEVLSPPIAGQGGTCIVGSIIDVYHQARGGDSWEILIKKISPQQEETITITPNPVGVFQYPSATNAHLTAGIYQVSLNYPEGWRPFTPDVFEVTLNGTSSECAQTRFKMEALASLEVTKLDDHGYLDFGERVGIPGWEITIRATDQDATFTEITDGDGKAYFHNLIPGDWIIFEEERAGWRPIAGYPVQRTITLLSPQNPGDSQAVVFINEQVHSGTIVVTKKDTVGQLLAGWTITLARSDGTQPTQTNVTGVDGKAYFQDLPIGKWVVSEVAQEWWRPTGITEQTVILDVPGATESVLFTNEALGCVDGYKINHLEQGLSGWEIKAINSESGEELSTKTDETGYFDFRLGLGTWILSEVQQEGWTAVTAPEFPIAITQPFTCEHVRFKNRTDYACVDVYKKDTYDNAGLPGWQITLQPAYGGVAQSAVTEGTGWVRFNMLTPGNYLIAEVEQPGWVSVGPSPVALELENSGTCAVVVLYNRQTNQEVYHIDDQSAPNQPAPPLQSIPDSPCSEHYTVKYGDTMYSIAQRFHTSWEELQSINHLTNARVIHSGLELCIPN